MKPSRIVILPPDLANQIAAGEVIERPASVIKELVENAIDAGATRVEVEIEQGGLKLIRVTDNGSGMTPEEAELSLQRHATSKLKNSDDLFRIHTLGFRGEALPSIAAVSRFTLTTRTPEEIAGFRLQQEAGKAQSPGQSVGAAVGTQIEVCDLLYNLPARLKFMKSEATEFGHCSEVMVRLALAFPHVHLRLKRAGVVTMDVPPHATLQQRAQAVLASHGKTGKTISLYPITYQGERIELEACVGDPLDYTTTARNVYLLVNHRFVRDRALLHACMHAYGTVLPQGKYPLLVMHLHLTGSQVDVNVHPQKMEVRFADPKEVYAVVQQTIQKIIQKAPWLIGEKVAEKSPPLGREPLGSPRDFAPSSVAAEPRMSYGRSFPSIAPRASAFSPPQPVLFAESREVVQDKEPLPDASMLFRFTAMRYLGQLHQTYLLCEHKDELILIDQHAAHERLAFERLRAAHAKKSVKQQRLLFPVQVTLPASRMALLDEHKEWLEKLGFEFRELGKNSKGLVAIPDMAEFGRGAKTQPDPQTLLERVLDDLQEHETIETTGTRIERVLATLACHSVVRAGDRLDEAPAKALLHAMDEIEFAPYCPHGRPILVRIDKAEIEKRFGRR